MTTALQAFQRLGCDDLVVLSGFVYGFAIVKRKRYMNEPLTTLLRCGINGFFYSIGTVIVAAILPRTLRGLVPSLTILASIYQTWFKKQPSSADDCYHFNVYFGPSTPSATT